MRTRAVLTGVVVALSAVTLAPTTAHAAPKKPTPPIVLEAAMLVTDIDEEQALRAGNRVIAEGTDRVLIDGLTGAELARVPINPPSSGGGALSTQGVVYGNCGSSYIYLRDSAGSKFYFYTGFDLNNSAVDFDWYVNVRGEYSRGADNYSWEDHGPIAFRDVWTSGNIFSTQDIPAGSYYYARVTSGRAYLANGGVCTTGYPSDGRYLYK